jgi:hypothetical protein
MKQSMQTLTATIKNFSIRIFFCSQLAIALLSLPLLYMIGISHHTQNETKKANQFIIMTNKGKKIIVTTYVLPNKTNPVITIG